MPFISLPPRSTHATSPALGPQRLAAAEATGVGRCPVAFCGFMPSTGSRVGDVYIYRAIFFLLPQDVKLHRVAGVCVCDARPTLPLPCALYEGMLYH